MSDLIQKKCVPCEGGVPTLTEEEIKKYMPQLKDGWEVLENIKIKKLFKLADFKEAMVFVNKVADLAESEGHHPDITIHYNKVDIVIWTHAIGGLSENDFILAAKIDNI
ncbi:MAG: 4a-hydroxytetrahydrobiopterin dehydratase [Candidatus Woesearchaeota archaeon]|nr:4a-hydroxytetrahydrobiopterin dehydratase [Candidatus Woesearchaeota archaeon]